MTMKTSVAEVSVIQLSNGFLPLAAVQMHKDFNPFLSIYLPQVLSILIVNIS